MVDVSIVLVSTESPCHDKNPCIQPASADIPWSMQRLPSKFPLPHHSNIIFPFSPFFIKLWWWNPGCLIIFFQRTFRNQTLVSFSYCLKACLKMLKFTFFFLTGSPCYNNITHTVKKNSNFFLNKWSYLLIF